MHQLLGMCAQGVRRVVEQEAYNIGFSHWCCLRGEQHQYQSFRCDGNMHAPAVTPHCRDASPSRNYLARSMRTDRGSINWSPKGWGRSTRCKYPFLLSAMRRFPAVVCSTPSRPASSVAVTVPPARRTNISVSRSLAVRVPTASAFSSCVDDELTNIARSWAEAISDDTPSGAIFAAKVGFAKNPLVRHGYRLAFCACHFMASRSSSTTFSSTLSVLTATRSAASASIHARP
jgi:hypothetical protein